MIPPQAGTVGVQDSEVESDGSDESRSVIPPRTGTVGVQDTETAVPRV